MRRLSVRLVFALTMAVAVALLGTSLTVAQSAYQFRLGFKMLADMIPSVVGQPLENEHYAANEDSLQQTTTGLMVWRKIDNWTAFTDGARTWLNGPEGLQERPNEQRFDWERAARVDTTAVTNFAPAGVKGPDQDGYCWTESLASGQSNAWRCMVGNRIYDPCFASSTDGSIVCGASPIADPYGFRLKLTQPLPQRKAAPSPSRPWLMVLADGVTCGYLTGASTGVGGERANYGCTDGWYILGDPTPGQIWSAQEAQITVTSQGPTLMDSATVDIKAVWR